MSVVLFRSAMDPSERTGTIVLPERIDFSTVIPYGIGEPDPITYPQRTNVKFVNGHITAKDVEMWTESLDAARERLDAIYEDGYELHLERGAYEPDEYTEASDALAQQRDSALATIERLQSAIDAGACAPGCQDHDVWLSYQGVVTQPDGSRRVVKDCDVPLPDIAVDGEVEKIDRYETVPDVLTSYATSDAAKSLAIEDVGFQYKNQVWVDGIPFGVVELDVDATDDVLPTFRYQYRGSDVRAVCVCGSAIVYSEVARKRGVLVEDGRENMRAFVAMLLLHAQALHPDVTREDVCKHGLRRYVQSKSRSTGQPFKAKFCSAKKDPCDPVWVND